MVCTLTKSFDPGHVKNVYQGKEVELLGDEQQKYPGDLWCDARCVGDTDLHSGAWTWNGFSRRRLTMTSCRRQHSSTFAIRSFFLLQTHALGLAFSVVAMGRLIVVSIDSFITPQRSSELGQHKIELLECAGPP